MPTDTAQLDLMPSAPIKIEGCEPPLDMLPPDEKLPSPPPSKALVESIKRMGVLTPITIALVGTGPYGYVVIDGRRRIKAARLAGLTRIPAAYVRDLAEHTVPSLTIHAHATRSANPLADLAAIRVLTTDLLRSGDHTEAEVISIVARSTGLAVGTVKQRLGLLALGVRWIEAVKAGRVTIGVAERLAKLPVERRDNLWAVLSAKGRLTEADLKAEVQKGATETASQFDWDQIDDVPTSADDQVPFDVLEGVRAALSERFENWEMDEATGTFVLSGVTGGSYRLRVERIR